MSSKRILVIAEGEKAEKAFLDAMKGHFISAIRSAASEEHLSPLH
jgi:hypothetical protein